MTFEELTEELKYMQGEIVIVYSTNLVRFVGLGEDEQDYYYICIDYHNKETWYSAVGHIDRLNGNLPSDIYNRIDKGFRYEYVPQPFKLIRKEDEAAYFAKIEEEKKAKEFEMNYRENSVGSEYDIT